jgi:hypothetical protein
MRRNNILFVITSLIILQISLCSISYSGGEDVMLFIQRKTGGFFNPLDIKSYKRIAEGFGLSTREIDFSSVNQKESFFEKDGKRKAKVFVIPGGIPKFWFTTSLYEEIVALTKKDKRRKAATIARLDKRGLGKVGINRNGVNNILRFIESGGSVICICYCGSSLFVRDLAWLCSNIMDIKRGKFDEYYPHTAKGYFNKFCGSYAFKGVLKGPQVSNMRKVPGLPPYPRFMFLPIKMNPENEIVKRANLPSVIHQVVVGGGSIIPDKGQPLDIVGWYPDGTVAIGIAPYGKGKIIMSNPHPNTTGRMAEFFMKGVMDTHVRNWGWTESCIAQGQKLMKDLRDPDGAEPDWALSKAMLRYAYEKGSE